jgi:hypothetical protein
MTILKLFDDYKHITWAITLTMTQITIGIFIASEFAWSTCVQGVNDCGTLQNYVIKSNTCNGTCSTDRNVLIGITYYGNIISGSFISFLGAVTPTKSKGVTELLMDNISTLSYIIRVLSTFSYMPWISLYIDINNIETYYVTLNDSGVWDVGWASLVLTMGFLISARLAISGKAGSKEKDILEKAFPKLFDNRPNFVKCFKWMITIILGYFICTSFIFYITIINVLKGDVYEWSAFAKPRGPGLLRLTYYVYGQIMLTVAEYITYARYASKFHLNDDQFLIMNNESQSKLKINHSQIINDR